MAEWSCAGTRAAEEPPSGSRVNESPDDDRPDTDRPDTDRPDTEAPDVGPGADRPGSVAGPLGSDGPASPDGAGVTCSGTAEWGVIEDESLTGPVVAGVVVSSAG